MAPLQIYSSIQGKYWYGTPTDAPPTTPAAFGTYKPGASTTGVPSGTEMTVHQGDIIMTTPGDVLDGYDVHGYVYMRGANQIVRNSIVRGSAPVTGTSNHGVVDTQSASCSGALIYSTLIQPDNAYISTGLTGILGHSFTARMVHVRHTVDGFGANSGPDKTNANVTLEGCWAHDLIYIHPDANHPDDHTHNDGFQIQYGGTYRVVGNTLQCLIDAAASPTASPYAPAGTGQAIGMTPNVSNIHNAFIDSNYLDGGAQPFTAIPVYNKASVPSSGIKFTELAITLTNNKFGRLGEFSYGIRINSDVVAGFTGMRNTSGTDTTNGNVWEDTGLPVLVSIAAP